MYDKLRNRGLTPKPHILDNEVSESLKKYFKYSDKNLQLVPPHIHQINDTERAVRTFKNHFIAALYTEEHLLLLYLWDIHLPQVTMKLNILRLSRLNPELSAYEQVYRIHNFE